MRFCFLGIFLICCTQFLFSQDCPHPIGLYTSTSSFNSSYVFVEGHWDSLLGTGVQHFLVNYKELGSVEWNNLANLDSSSTSKIIPFLDFNTSYIWRVGSFCSESYQDPAEWSVIDTFTTIE